MAPESKDSSTLQTRMSRGKEEAPDSSILPREVVVHQCTMNLAVEDLMASEEEVCPQKRWETLMIRRNSDHQEVNIDLPEESLKDQEVAEATLIESLSHSTLETIRKAPMVVLTEPSSVMLSEAIAV